MASDSYNEAPQRMTMRENEPMSATARPAHKVSVQSDAQPHKPNHKSNYPSHYK